MIGIKSLMEASAAHGGKASGLRLLIEKGLRVPDGIVLDSDTVRSLLDGNLKVTEQLHKWLASVNGRLAIRSSALNEDGVDHSFAGMYESVLEIEPKLDAVVENIRRISASGRSDRVRAYAGKTYDIIPVVIQKLIEASVSGVMFSKAIDPFGVECAYVEWVFGFGDALVSGKSIPASFRIPWKADAARLDRNGVQITGNMPNCSHVESLIQTIETINGMASRFGWDIEWATDADQQLWILQVRPATKQVLVPALRKGGDPLPASSGIGRGIVRFVDDANCDELQDGEVLVAEITEVNYIPAMKRAAAIVTEQGGLLSHAAIVAREFGKPCVVGAVGAKSLLTNFVLAEVNGSAGTVRQGDVVIGEGASQEIDWTSIFLYDRGFETVVDSICVYVEPTLSGIVVYIDDDATVDQQQRIDASIRRKFGTVPSIVKSDKRIWYREVCRYEQFRTFTFVESLFKSSLVAWDSRQLQHAITSLNHIVLEVGRQLPETHLEQLFWKEIGVALHTFVAIVVEGSAVWGAYRDSATWREHNKVRFADFLHSPYVVGATQLDLRIASILDCIGILAKLRNEAFLHFSTNSVFNSDYFGNRESLVKAACVECGTPFTTEDASLTKFYRSERFRDLDRQLLRAVYVIVDGTCL